MVKSQCLPLCQTLQKLKNVGRPNPLAHDNKAITILSFLLWYKCIWGGLNWTFLVSSSVVARWSEHWGSWIFPVQWCQQHQQGAPRIPSIRLSSHQPPTPTVRFYLTSKLYWNSTHLAWTEEPTSLHELNLALSLLSSKQLPTQLKLSLMLQMTLDKYWRVVFPLP